MLRVALKAMNGVGIGLLLGVVVGGMFGFFYVSSNRAPNGNPSEIQFFHLMQNVLGVVLAVVCAAFGGGVGAAMGAIVGSLLAFKRRATVESNSSVDTRANPDALGAEERRGPPEPPRVDPP